MAFNSLIDATPVPENRAKTPKGVQTINKWLGEDKNSDILKDILEVAANIIKIHNLGETIEGTNIIKQVMVHLSFIKSKTIHFFVKFQRSLITDLHSPKKINLQPQIRL